MGWIRDWSWRITLLALPWQTRWFTGSLTLGGMPWEQGRWAVYASWIPLFLTVLIATLEPFEPAEHPLSPNAWVGAVGLLLITLPVCLTAFLPASIQWLLQIALLSFFAWAILHLRVDRQSFLTWCVLAIIPHALLAISQFLSQQVIGSEILGMSSQLPATLGVSVIAVGATRILRAYGGMPHPNILGGWLAFGLLALTQLAPRVTSRQQKWLLGTGALFAICLVLTFSRSAWLAATLALVTALVLWWRKAWTLEDKQRVMSVAAVLLVSAGLVGLAVNQLVMVRASNDTRLELKSTNERLTALKNSWSLVSTHPVLGTGQNTTIFALSQAGLGIVPPHMSFLLIFLETGILGSLGFLLLVGRWIHHTRRQALLPLLLVLPLALFDHYVWSLWAGQCLVMMLALYPLTEEPK
jgi:O-antigen ligase